MELRPRSTRVKAPDISSSSTRGAARRALMTPASQSLLQDGGRLTHVPKVWNTKPKASADFRKSFRIATWNVLTLAHTGYPEALAKELAKYRISMAGLTESRIPGSGLRNVEGFSMFHSGAANHTNGVALMLNKTLADSVTTWRPVSDRLLYARLQHRHGHLSVIVSYAPTEPTIDTNKDVFYQQLESLVAAIPPHDLQIILGDFNAVSGTDRQGYEQVVGNYGSGVVNDNSTRLLSLCSAHRLSIVGSWFARKNIHRHSWICNDGRTRKEIDHILTNNRSLFKSIRVFRGVESPANTDHRLVAAEIALHPYKAPKQSLKNRLDTAKLAQDLELAAKYNIAVSNAFTALGSLPDNVEEAWATTRQTILTTAADIIPVQRQQRRPWLTSETLDIIEQKRKARLKGDSDECRRLKGVFKAKSKVDLEQFYNSIADEAEAGFRQNNLRPAYRAIKRLKGGCRNDTALSPVARLDGSLCTTAEEIEERWREHYQSVLNHSAATPSPELDEHAFTATLDQSISEDAPTLDEVASAIRRLRNGRAAGSDEITPELLKFAEAPISHVLHKLFATVWSSGKIPAEWKEGIIISLYKGKGPHSACNSYRPITLLSVPGKVFAHVILARIQPLLDRCKRRQQSGFTAGRSTVDAILALRLLSELHRAFNRPLHTAYIDVKAAFDSVDRAALWKALQGTGMPSFLLHLIRDLHTSTSARVRTRNGLSSPFATTSGVRQGCILAPALFCCAIDWLMSQCSNTFGISVGDDLFGDIDYADDAVLFARNPLDWDNILRSYETAANTMGLHCNWQKTKIQNVGSGPTPPPVHIDGHIVDPVSKFTYLGSDINADGYSTPEIHRRLGIAYSVMGQLDAVWRRSRLSLNTKLRIYSSLVLSVLLYGSETWTLRKTDSDRIQAFHTKSQRRILGIHWYEHVTNAAVKELTSLEDLPPIIADRRHLLFGHICRLPADAPAHRALQICVKISQGLRPGPDWRRPPGRPRKTWLQQLEEDSGMSPAAAWSSAQDRLLWRSLRPSLATRHSE